MVSGTLNVVAAGSATLTGNGSGSVTISGTQADINATLASLVYQGNANFNGADTLTVTATDGNAAASSATIAIGVGAVNDAPTVAIPGGQTIAEDTPLILGGALAIVVADVDATAPQVTLSAANGVITLASTAGLTFSAGDGLGNVTMTFTGSVAAINAALNGLEFLPDLNFSGAASIAVAVSDLGQSGAGGTLTAAGSVAIAVTAANDAPVAIADGYVIAEDGTLTVNAAAGVLANDTDSDGPAMTAVVVSGPANGVLVLNADGSFTYVPNADFSGTDSFVYQASDGTLQSAATTVSINVTPVNDAPVNTVPGAQTMAEDTPLVFSAGNGNAVAVTDVDAGTSPVRMTVTVTNGTVTLAGTAGLTFLTGDGVNDATLSFTGTLADVNAALSALVFQGTPDYYGAANVQLVTDDLGSVGAGGAQSTTTNIAVNVTPVNDAPVLVNNTLTLAPGARVVLGSGNLSATDVDDAAAALMFTVEDLANGQFELVGAPGVAVTQFTQGDVLSGNVVFVHTGSDAPTYRIRVTDGAASDTPRSAVIVYTQSGGPGFLSEGGGGGVSISPPEQSFAGLSGGGASSLSAPDSSTFLRAPTTPDGAGDGGDPAAVVELRDDLLDNDLMKVMSASVDPGKTSVGDAIKVEPVQIAADLLKFDDLAQGTTSVNGREFATILARAPQLDQTSDSQERYLQVVLDGVKVTGLAMSVGVVWWALRASSLVASLLASAPAWRHIDPLPVLGRGDEDEEDVEWGDAEDAESKRDEQAASWVLGERSA